MKRSTSIPAFLVALAMVASAQHGGGGGGAATGPSLDPNTIPKYVQPLIIPPAMPRTSVLSQGGTAIDYYEIAVRQFQQQILPPGMPATTVWSYGSVNHAGTFNYPAFTIEAKYRRPVRVKWINGLVDASGRYLPHLLAVDQTLHWANPPGPRDDHGHHPMPYTGPVPIVTHVHGARTLQESDGYPEAWWLPNATNIPAGFFRTGTYYDLNKASGALGSLWSPGSAVFQYPNDQAASTLWYHDHTLGMTRLNVYAGPAGFYLLRGGPADQVTGRLPGPAPALGDPAGARYYEIPIVIQDRAFNADGSLFYPDNRAYFEGLDPSQLQIPFHPEGAIGGPSDIAPIWNPEFFGNVMVVNGRAWPTVDVEQRRYRLRLLNGCGSRFLLLEFGNGLPFWQIGSDGGFLPQPVQLQRLLLGPAERADVIVDFGLIRNVGNTIRLLNRGPDEPFAGGDPDLDFDAADPATTGQVMQFRIVRRQGSDSSSPPSSLRLPNQARLGNPAVVRQLTLNEQSSSTVLASQDADGNVVLDPNGEPFGPQSAVLGVLNPDGSSTPLVWQDPVTEMPVLGDTEIWEIHNLTVDAHPIHLHLVQFEVRGRKGADGVIRPPEAWERGFKDTVIAYPGEVTRVKARFDLAGLYVWHCHIIEHEDNEMMRPFQVVAPLAFSIGTSLAAASVGGNTGSLGDGYVFRDDSLGFDPTWKADDWLQDWKN